MNDRISYSKVFYIFDKNFKMKYILLLVLSLVISQVIYPQTKETLALDSLKIKKTYQIQVIDSPPVIDGVVNESVWDRIPIATDFIMFRPGNGDKAPEAYRTEVRLAYDNEAIYVAAMLYDSHPEIIPMQFSTRDNFAQTDFFLLALNPNNDGVNDTEFVVMSTGTQADARVSFSNGEDFNWSAVWESDVKLLDNGWSLEMKIPYSALRFSAENVKDWGMNIHRRIQSKKEQYSWNFIDKSKGTYTEYAGKLIGIKNVDTPTRLSFYPYAQGLISHYDGDTKTSGTAGMDIKYGLSDSFTLDATLIPDFGQTAYDDVVLNLGPFEQEYDEKRAFFTEGVEMFAKGNLIYSRRVGDVPMNYYDEDSLDDNEKLESNPEKTRLLNAIKFTGRTKGGLGIGLFNAVVDKSEASIKNVDTDQIRKVLTSPLTNYNALVLDQQFKNTSSLSLINTSVLRSGHAKDADVTSLLSDIRLFKNKYSLSTEASMSNIHENQGFTSGYAGSLFFRNVTGSHRFSSGVDFADKLYDKNDMGIMYHNNFMNFYAYYGYRIFEPKGNLNSFNLNVNLNHERLYKPSIATYNNVNINANMTNKKELSYGAGGNIGIGDENDYYEPRVDGRFHKDKPVSNVFAWISTDYRKKLAIDATIAYGQQFGIDTPEGGPYIELRPRFRFSDHFQLTYEFDYDQTRDEKAYVDRTDDTHIYFGNRNSDTYENSLNGTYNFSTKAVLSLSMRHYWIPVKYDDDFYFLNQDGTLSESDFSDNFDVNYNVWNLDLNFAWEFAPGSQLIAQYRNSYAGNTGIPDIKFFRNFRDNLFHNPFEHQVSLRMVYYIDYNKLF